MGNDLPDYQMSVSTGALEASSLVNGADAAKSATPAVGDVYLATDTQKLYICVATGAWTGFDAAILVQGTLTLYAALAGGGYQVNNIADPTSAQDAATKTYVDGAVKQTASGSYTGNGGSTAIQKTTGFKCRLVVAFDTTSLAEYHLITGVSVRDFSGSLLDITSYCYLHASDGFVIADGGAYMNTNGHTYKWIAFEE